MSINQNPVITEIHFMASTMTWNIFMFGRTINPGDIGLDNNNFCLTKKSIEFVCTVVKSRRIYKGMKELGITDQYSVIKEVLLTEDCYEETLYRSVKCVRVLKFNTGSDSPCSECRMTHKASRKRTSSTQPEVRPVKYYFFK